MGGLCNCYTIYMNRYLLPLFITTLFFACFTAHAQFIGPVQETHPMRILIVPGHDTTTVGAAYQDMRETDMTAALAEAIRAELSNDPAFDVTVSRTRDVYLPELQKYFDTKRTTVERYVKAQKRKMAREIKSGDIEVPEQVPHADTAADPAYRLYATSHWADEKEFDLILHIHFNDYGARRRAEPGMYQGFSIYVPDPQLPSSTGTEPVGSRIAKQLAHIWPASTNPTESSKVTQLGVIRDLNLIALGSNQTLKTPAVLVEYGYIYQDEFSSKMFPMAVPILARAMTGALQESVTGVSVSDPLVAYDWKESLRPGTNISPEVMMLQMGLREVGAYPADDMPLDGCPFSGMYGACTKAAVKAFQTTHRLTVDGIFGLKTSAALEAALKAQAK